MYDYLSPVCSYSTYKFFLLVLLLWRYVSSVLHFPSSLSLLSHLDFLSGLPYSVSLCSSVICILETYFSGQYDPSNYALNPCADRDARKVNGDIVSSSHASKSFSFDGILRYF